MEDREVKILSYEPSVKQLMDILKDIPEDASIAISDRVPDPGKPFAHIKAKYYKDFNILQLVRHTGA